MKRGKGGKKWSGRLRRVLAAGALAAVLVGVGPAPAAGATPDAVTVYGGRFSVNPWEDFFLSPGGIDYLDGWLLAVAPSWSLVDRDARWALEAEGQLVKHFGGQDHEEINAALTFRWRGAHGGPGWRTGAAFGIGPSWASRTPLLEEEINGGGSERVLVHWFIEGTLRPAGWGPWRLVARLHHRSGAYGWVADEGGSNVPSLGLRRRF